MRINLARIHTLIGGSLCLYFTVMAAQSIYTYTDYTLTIAANQVKILQQETTLAQLNAELATIHTPDYRDGMIRKRFNYVSDADIVYKLED